jgi:hypothetical protein
MGKVIRCPECGEVYRMLERLEDLRDNDGVCLVCNAPIEVADWDRVLASYEDDDLDDVEDLDEVDYDDGEDEDEDDEDEDVDYDDERWDEGDDLDGFEDLDEDLDDEGEERL